MKRLFYLPIAFIAVMVAAPTAWAQPIQTFEAKAKKSRAGQGTDFTLAGSTSMPDGSKPPGVRGFTVTGPVGAKINRKVASTCAQSKLESTGRCPTSSRLDKGARATARVDFGPFGTLPVTDLKVYRNKTCPSGTVICALIRGSEPQTGVTVILPANVYMRGGAPVIEMPDTILPDVLGVEPVLTSMNVPLGKTKTVTKRKKVRGKRRRVRVKKYLYTNPKKCTSAGWSATIDITYADGTTNSVTSTQKCKKAKKKKKK